MRPLCFTLRESLRFSVDIAILNPSKLKGKNRKQIGAIKLRYGGEQISVSSLFSITGSDTSKVRFNNCSKKLTHIGCGLTDGQIHVSGDTGDYLGRSMSGGYIEVSGNCGNFTGSAMTGGKVEVHGNAGNYLGAAATGDTIGMNEGTIIVHGDAGFRTGDRMRRGMIVIFGNVGDYCASNMLAGTIIILGKTGGYIGFNMKRGTLILASKPRHILSTFRSSGLLKVEFLRLLFKQLAQSCKQFEVFSCIGPEAIRFAGDTSIKGMGEILILKNARIPR